MDGPLSVLEFLPKVTHGGRFLEYEYNICGKVFEINSKYRPLVKPSTMGHTVSSDTFVFILPACSYYSTTIC
jgi:hypothetical protein